MKKLHFNFNNDEFIDYGFNYLQNEFLFLIISLSIYWKLDFFQIVFECGYFYFYY